MPTDAEQLQSARDAIETFARAYEPNREVHIRAQDVGPGALPATARAAFQFYDGVLNPPDDTYGVTHAFRQLPEDGVLFIVIGNGCESGWGVAEVYDAGGTLLAVGIYSAGMVAWTDQGTARNALVSARAPLELFKPAKLEWIAYTPTLAFSVGGRFNIRDAYGAPGSVLEDRLNSTEHPCASFADAQVLAATFFAQP